MPVNPLVPLTVRIMDGSKSLVDPDGRILASEDPNLIPLNAQIVQITVYPDGYAPTGNGDPIEDLFDEISWDLHWDDLKAYRAAI